MDSKRQKKFSRLIQKDLGEIMQQASRDMFGGAFITVTQVNITPDLSIAKIYLSFLMVEDKEGLLNLVNEKKSYLRKQLGNRIRHQARVIPDLLFFIDNTEDVVEEVNKLFEGLEIPPETNEDEEEQD
ncbi:30S ribosome-binding factor RbfA [Flammeovirgaceae bacterium SG7u.111]|nr:30S ribosome-binding factor RbfA [Flammeovirgaceae bacterium SG7u.132]WPO37110.1 30S ribosome-binding factor RbfA [Flammeovirgaceae bacterium SG7u.111]